MALIVAVVAIGGGLTGAALVLKPPFLGFKKVLDRAALEKTIEHESGGVLGDLSCPAAEEVKAGNSFQCSAAGGRKINVVVRDSKGNYVWAPAN